MTIRRRLPLLTLLMGYRTASLKQGLWEKGMWATAGSCCVWRRGRARGFRRRLPTLRGGHGWRIQRASQHHRGSHTHSMHHIVLPASCLLFIDTAQLARVGWQLCSTDGCRNPCRPNGTPRCNSSGHSAAILASLSKASAAATTAAARLRSGGASSSSSIDCPSHKKSSRASHDSVSELSKSSESPVMLTLVASKCMTSLTMLAILDRVTLKSSQCGTT
mmetsp:Transcript_44180/g.116996  ORF Transcript_44180/g.116996 Transcript_44180/m.116996 type:complete len:219 (-) Transcript_44180:1887-2543(-)